MARGTTPKSEITKWSAAAAELTSDEFIFKVTLEFLFDDGITDHHDADLADITAAHRDDPQTPDDVVEPARPGAPAKPGSRCR